MSEIQATPGHRGTLEDGYTRHPTAPRDVGSLSTLAQGERNGHVGHQVRLDEMGDQGHAWARSWSSRRSAVRSRSTPWVRTATSRRKDAASRVRSVPRYTPRQCLVHRQPPEPCVRRCRHPPPEHARGQARPLFCSGTSPERALTRSTQREMSSGRSKPTLIPASSSTPSASTCCAPARGFSVIPGFSTSPTETSGTASRVTACVFTAVRMSTGFRVGMTTSLRSGQKSKALWSPKGPRRGVRRPRGTRVHLPAFPVARRRTPRWPPGSADCHRGRPADGRLAVDKTAFLVVESAGWAVRRAWRLMEDADRACPGR